MRLLDEGRSYSQVAALVESSKSSVCRWNQTCQRQRQHQRHSRKTKASNRSSPHQLGRPCKLSDAQIGRLQRELGKGAYAYGYAGDFWTLERIAHLIFQLFEVRYHPSSVWHLMQRIGWSCQKPHRLAVQRDEVAIARWRQRVFPQLKKRGSAGC
jgi:transposase